jgi:hypothetical protein
MTHIVTRRNSNGKYISTEGIVYRGIQRLLE